MSTTTSPAPVTPPPRLGARPRDTEPHTDEGRTTRRLAVWGGDGIAVLVLATVLWWLASHDGGRNLAESLPGVWVIAAFLPWAPAELRRLPRTGRVLVAWLMLGALVAIGFGTVRTDFEETAVTFATVVLTGLAAHRVWRRDWGPVALLLVLVVSFGLYWQRSFLQWWGGAGSAGTQWLALSWHNQSGTLMAAFGLLFLGVAAVGRRLLVPVGLLLSAGGFAGTWLSGSRGALAATVLGLVVVLWAGIREQGLLRTVAVTASAAVLTVGVVGWLTFVRADVGAPAGPASSSISPEDALGQPLFERDEDASSNALRRLQHIQAALGMFVDRPLTGHGLGSYGPASIRWSSPDANLTRYAHNRYAQTLGEGGLAAGLPLLGLVACVGLLCWRRLVSRPEPEEASGLAAALPDARPAVTAGLTAVAALVATHSMIDFDWTFPILPMALAIAGGALAADHASASRTEPRAGSRFATATVALMLLVGAAGHLLAVSTSIDPEGDPELLARSFRPWQADRGSAVALLLSEGGHHGAARRTIDRVALWSPGLSSIATEGAVIAYRAGDATPEDVATTLEVGEDWFGSFNLAASSLIEGGDHEVAQRILRTAIDAYPRYDAWDRGQNEAESYALLVRSLGSADQCGVAREVVEAAPRLELVDLAAVLVDSCGPSGPQ